MITIKQALHVDEDTGQYDTVVDKDRQIVFEPDKSEVAEDLQNGQTDTEGGDHFRQGLAAHAQQDKTVHQRSCQHCQQDGDGGGHRVGHADQVQPHPGGVGGEDVQRTVGKVRHAADPEGQVEADRHQGQDDRVDEGVYNGAQ